jgi:hypothetical protein
MPGDLDFFEIIVSAGDLIRWPFKSCLQWAAGSDGKLQQDRLKRIAAARGYKAAWVQLVVDKDWLVVWNQSVDWHQRE